MGLSIWKIENFIPVYLSERPIILYTGLLNKPVPKISKSIRIRPFFKIVTFIIHKAVSLLHIYGNCSLFHILRVHLFARSIKMEPVQIYPFWK